MNKFTTLLLYSLIAVIAVLASDTPKDKTNPLKTERDNFDSFAEFNAKFGNALGFQLNAPKYVNQKCEVITYLLSKAEVSASLTKEEKAELLKDLEGATAKYNELHGKRSSFSAEVSVLLQQSNKSKNYLNKLADEYYKNVEGKEVSQDQFAAALSNENDVQLSVTFHLCELALNNLFSTYDDLAQTVETTSLRFNFLYPNLSKLLTAGKSYELNDALTKQVTINGRYLFTLLKRLDLYLNLTTFFNEKSSELNKLINKGDSHGNTYVEELRKEARDAAEYNEYVFNVLNPKLVEIHGLLLSAQNYNDGALLTLSNPVLEVKDYFEVFKAFKSSTEKLVTALAELRSSASTQYFALVYGNFHKLVKLEKKVKGIEEFRLEQLNYEQEQQRKAELKKEVKLVADQDVEREQKLEETHLPLKKGGKNSVKKTSFKWVYLVVGTVVALVLAACVVAFKVWRDLRSRNTEQVELLNAV